MAYESIIVLEDGTCPAGANSYATLAQADAYAVPRGLWAASEDETVLAARERALIRASDWLNGLDWRGAAVDADRTMAWPREAVYVHGEPFPSDAVPAAVAVSCIEAAACIINGDDLLAVQEYAGAVTSRSAKVGPIEESYAYGKGGASVVPSRPALTGRIRLFLRSLPEDQASGNGAIVYTVGRA